MKVKKIRYFDETNSNFLRSRLFILDATHVQRTMKL